MEFDKLPVLPVHILIQPQYQGIMLSLLHLESELELCGGFGYHELVLVCKSLGGSELRLKMLELVFVFGGLLDREFELFNAVGVDRGLINLYSVYAL